MNKTKIEWCDMTWNPVTGCLYGCEYCYARKIARRYEGCWDGDENVKITYRQSDSPKEVSGYEFGGLGYKYCVGNDKRGEPKLINAPYPYGFHPTLQKHRLETGLVKYKKPKNIFVGSMTDLFGKWVPDKWIKQVFEACIKAPQHRYLFLTKNPDRYDAFFRCWEAPENFWFGTSINHSERDYYRAGMNNTFLSIEPIQSDFNCDCWTDTDWVIIGAETGNRKGKIIPKKEWIENIVNYCKEKNVPVFMKNSLKDIWQEPLIQEFPWRDV